MNLKDQLIHDSMSECANRIKIIDQHAGQLAEAESLTEALRRVAPHLSGKASAYVSGDILTTRVLIIAAKESELRAAIAAADLAVESIQPGTPTADSMRIHLAGGIRTVIDIIIAVDEFDAEAQPPAAMPWPRDQQTNPTAPSSLEMKAELWSAGGSSVTATSTTGE